MARKKRGWPQTGDPLPAPVMDNHTHLPLCEEEIPLVDGYRMSLGEQLERAQQMRVTQIISSGCSLPDLKKTVNLARQWPQVRVALAIHPNEAALHAGNVDTSPDGYEHSQDERHVPLVEAIEKVAHLLDDPTVVALGESGLDYFRTAQTGWDTQKESLKMHLELARAHQLPIQLHVRDAYQDAIEILKDTAWKNIPIVFHCFSGDVETGKQIAQKGWYASFAGPITYQANKELRNALLEIPRESVLVETDAPYLTPVPHRGCPNASYSMPHTVRKIAELWDVNPERACNILMHNSQKLYGTW